jgi:putative phosphonate metabolism protein
MITKARYAIYFVPGADTALYQFGASVLGYDCYTGRNAALISGVDSLPWAEFVREPGVYGFHATLKAPFRLADGMSEAGLASEALSFAANHPAVLVGDLVIRELGAFIALVPNTQRRPLDWLAQACVREFDNFRAPLTAQERDRRLAADLTARQTDYLDRWGYPYVFEEFRFHMTLTGRLSAPDRARALRLLCDKYTRIPRAKSLVLDRIVVAHQPDRSSPFRVLRQAPLGESPYRPLARRF